MLQWWFKELWLAENALTANQIITMRLDPSFTFLENATDRHILCNESLMMKIMLEHLLHPHRGIKVGSVWTVTAAT